MTDAQYTAYFFMFIISLVGVYILGTALIDSYFKRKELFVDTLNAKLKGESNGFQS